MNNYKLLPALHSLLKTCNITDSARELHVTQSSMSKTLTQIRTAFQDPILIREGNKFVLSARASALKAQLPQVMTELDNLYRPARFNAMLCQRQFSLAVTPFFPANLTSNICQNIESIAPQVDLHTILWQEEQLSMLADQELDLAAALAEEIPENIHGNQIGEDTYVVVLRQGHPMVAKTLTMESYLAAKHLVVNGGSERYRQVDIAFSKHQKKRRIYARVPSFEVALHCISNTDCIMTAPRRLMSYYAKSHAVSIQPLPFDLPPHKYYLLWHAKHHHDQEHQWFRQVCLDTFEQYFSR